MDMDGVFGPGGVIASRFPGYENRKEQLELANAVWETVEREGGEILAAEAPPGVGKTFALLLPALLHCIPNDGRILVLTGGIPLQEQLVAKDIPSMEAILGRPVSHGLLKGRGNYACIRRCLELEENGFLSFGDEGDTSRMVLDWIGRTETGDLAELSLDQRSPVLPVIASSSRGCIGSACPHRDRCFVLAQLRRAQEWQVVVANYHLFFSYILEAGKPFPIPFDILLCDEAHRMADSARSVATVMFSPEDLLRVLRGKPGSLTQFLRGNGVDADGLQSDIEEARNEARAFGDRTELLCPDGECLPRNNADWSSRGKLLAGRLDSICSRLRRIDEDYRNGAFEASPEAQNAASASVWFDEVREIRESLSWCLSLERYPEWTFWREGRGCGSAPIRCDKLVSEAIGRSEPDAVVCVSATLFHGDRPSFWSRETGIEPTKILRVGSPFDLPKQMELVIVDSGFEVRDSGYDAATSRIIEHLCQENGGRTLVLVSSYRLLGAVAARMTSKPREYEVLVQGTLPRKELLERFRDLETSVLIGSVSFREGIDVPGESLTQVIIDRIPFPHPSDPVVQARNDLESGRSFMSFTLPMATLLLRQAVGRLIRTASDRGRVVILDRRLLDRPDWGILSSLPRVPCRRLRVRNSAKNVAASGSL